MFATSIERRKLLILWKIDRGSYSKEESIQWRKLYEEIRYLDKMKRMKYRSHETCVGDFGRHRQV